MDMTERRPIYSIHPGTVLADELEELGMSAADLARAIHVPNRIYQLIAGKRAMTADTAIHLEQWLGVNAAFWLNLQKTYELDVAMAESGCGLSCVMGTSSSDYLPYCYIRFF